MAELRKYKCGHDGDVPRHQGRGAPREQRLSQYFGRVCQACAVQRASELSERLTDSRANPLPDDVRAAWLHRQTEKIKASY